MKWAPALAIVAMGLSLVTLTLREVVDSAGALGEAMAVDCNIDKGGIQSNCTVASGATFFVDVAATNVGSGYAGYQIKLAWADAVLDYSHKSAANFSPLDCFEAHIDNQPGDPSAVLGCASAAPATSPGVLARFEMQCQMAGKSNLSLLPRLNDPQGGTHFIAPDLLSFIDPSLSAGSVTCGNPPTPSNTPTFTPTPTETPTLTPTPTPNPNGTMAIDCKAETSPVELFCFYGSGEEFTLAVRSESPVSGQSGYQVKVRWAEATLQYQGGSATNSWPNCIPSTEIEIDNRPGDSSFIHGCSGSLAGAYSGELMTFNMACESDGTSSVTLVPRLGDAQLGTHFTAGDGPTLIDPSLTGSNVTCGTPATRTPTPNPYGALAVDCNGGDGGQPGIQSTCAYNKNQTFNVDVHVTRVPSGGYTAHQVKLRWDTATLNYTPNASPAAENLWLNCTIPARIVNDPGAPPNNPVGASSVVYGCAPFPALTSGKTATGVILRFQFGCDPGVNGLSPLTLVPAAGDVQLGTHFLDEASTTVEPQITNATVTCGIPTPTPTTTPTPTPTYTATPSPTATPTPDPNTIDSDGDGCSDGEENGPDAFYGGQRDRFNAWDFFDTPVLDGAVTIGDVSQLVARFGATEGPPPTNNYDSAYDRTPLGPFAWNIGPPDGRVTIVDVTLIVHQFGHTCQGPGAS
jgi:hypothetical protein